MKTGLFGAAMAGLLIAATVFSAPAVAVAAPDDLAAPILDTSAAASTHPLTLPPSAEPFAGPVPSCDWFADPPSKPGLGTLTGWTYVGDTLTGTSGITVTAVQFDADGAVTFERSIVSCNQVTALPGFIRMIDVPPGKYWIHYLDDRDPAHVSGQWYGSSPTDLMGSQLTVNADESANASVHLVSTGGVSGTVSCEGCSAAPDPADVTMVLAIPKAGAANEWTPLDSEHPQPDGSYSWPYLYPGRYMVFAVYDGDGPYSAQSNSDAFDLAAQASVTADVLIARLIAPLAGVRPAINSVVSALYSDFLNRLPSPPEASGWANLLQNIHVPRTAVADGFVGSDEYRLIRIDAAYQNILGRAAEESGRQFWLANMKAGLITTDDIETSLYASEEYFDNHGGTNVTFARALYSALLHRGGGESDWAFWGALADQNGRLWVVEQFWDEPETIGERVTLMYEKYLGRVPDAGGLQSWVRVALSIGDSGLRAGLTGSDEYYLYAERRFQES